MKNKIYVTHTFKTGMRDCNEREIKELDIVEAEKKTLLGYKYKYYKVHYSEYKGAFVFCNGSEEKYLEELENKYKLRIMEK